MTRGRECSESCIDYLALELVAHYRSQQAGGPPLAAAIEAIGLRVGRQLIERYTKDKAPLVDQLEVGALVPTSWGWVLLQPSCGCAWWGCGTGGRRHPQPLHTLRSGREKVGRAASGSLLFTGPEGACHRGHSAACPTPPAAQVMKFVCKDFWAEVFRKNIDNLRTNKRCVGGAAGGAGCRERRGGTHWVCPQCGRRAQLALPANAAWPQWPIHVWARDAAAALTTSVLQRRGGVTRFIHHSLTLCSNH